MNCCTNALCKANATCQTCTMANPCPSGNWCCRGDTCDSYINLTDPANSNSVNNADGTYYGSTYGNNNQFDYGCCSNQNGSYAPDRVYHFDTKNDSVGVQLQLRAWGTFDTVLYIRRGACGGSGVNYQYNDDGCGLGNGGSCFTVNLLPNQDYWIYVDGWGTNKGDYTLTMDFTSLCGNCVCDSTYGENQTNNPDECYQSGDFCGNYINIPVSGKPQRFIFPQAGQDGNLAGDHDDFSHYGSYTTYNYGSDCSWCHDGPDKIYRLNLPWSANVIFRIEKYGAGWSPNNYPRLYIWQGGTCPGIGTKRIHFGSTSNYYVYGDGGDNTAWPASGVKSLSAGTYWLITDVYYEQGLSSAGYRLTVTVW